MKRRRRKCECSVNVAKVRRYTKNSRKQTHHTKYKVQPCALEPPVAHLPYNEDCISVWNTVPLIGGRFHIHTLTLFLARKRVGCVKRTIVSQKQTEFASNYTGFGTHSLKLRTALSAPYQVHFKVSCTEVFATLFLCSL